MDISLRGSVRQRSPPEAPPSKLPKGFEGFISFREVCNEGSRVHIVVPVLPLLVKVLSIAADFAGREPGVLPNRYAPSGVERGFGAMPSSFGNLLSS
jgi:hypothetical protein